MKPRALMFTLFGEYVQYYGGEIWVGSLIKLMKLFGVSESSVRGALLRMVQKDLMTVRKIGNKSYYSFTEQGKRQINEGVGRVYAARTQNWDGQWRILTYSFPESKRDLRNEIRKELNWIGFGVISNSTWVSPNPVEDQVLDVIERNDLAEYMILFSSSQVLSHDVESIINEGWDLDEIAEQYNTFIRDYENRYRQLKDEAFKNTLSDEACFIKRTQIVHDYRKFLFQDPIFPRDLLPDHWPGNEARELFWNMHQLISMPAIRYFESVYEKAPDSEFDSQRDKAIHPFEEVRV